MFWFRQQEVWCALDEYGLEDRKDKVRDWYDGFIFRQKGDIYNPWSIINYLKSGKFSAYWANTGSNSLVGKLIREGSPDIKMIMEDLLTGKELCTQLYEQIIFSQPEHKESAIRTLHIRKWKVQMQPCIKLRYSLCGYAFFSLSECFYLSDLETFLHILLPYLFIFNITDTRKHSHCLTLNQIVPYRQRSQFKIFIAHCERVRSRPENSSGVWLSSLYDDRVCFIRWSPSSACKVHDCPSFHLQMMNTFSIPL